MAFRPELDASIGVEAIKPANTVGWGCDVDEAGTSPHSRVHVFNESGFDQIVIVLNSEGLTADEIDQQCLYDTIDEVRRRRHGP